MKLRVALGVMALAASFVGVACKTAAPNRAIGEHIVDLTEFERPRRPIEVTPIFGAAPVTERKLGIEITLVGMDKKRYRPGNVIVFDLVIKNVGDEVFGLPRMPWDFATGYLEREASVLDPVIAAEIEFIATDANNQQVVVAKHVLKGSTDDLGTIEIITPGEEMKVRLPAFLTISKEDAARVFDTATSTIPVRATLEIVSPLGTMERPVSAPGGPVTSLNELRIPFRIR
jgi:hypothetical protein